MSLEFTSAVRSADPIPFRLDGVEFTFQPVKQATLIMPYIEGTEDYLRAAFRFLYEGLDAADKPKADEARAAASTPEEEAAAAALEGQQSAAIKARLADPTDPLDIPDVIALVNALDKEYAGRPTT